MPSHMMDDDEPEDMLSDSAMDADGLDSQKEHAWGQGANTPSNIPFQSRLYHLYSINTNRTICLPARLGLPHSIHDAPHRATR
jgi:hypothetical protein